MRVALDTNVLAYAERINGPLRESEAIGILSRFASVQIFVPVQVLGELFSVLTKKTTRTRGQVRAAVLSWQDAYIPIETSLPILLAATDLAAHHRFRIWDAIIIASAASANCRLLLSEDLQDGFTWSGCTVVNPFAKKPNELLRTLLDF